MWDPTARASRRTHPKFLTSKQRRSFILGGRLNYRSAAALHVRGTIAIGEFLVNKDRTGPVGSLFFSGNMLVNTDEGDTYSFEEISEWLGEAGFVNPRLLEARGPSPLVLATKP